MKAAFAVVAASILATLIVSSVAVAPSAKTDYGCAGTFKHGIASGHPLPRGIVLWTRVTPTQEGKGLLGGRWLSEPAPPANVHWAVWPVAHGVALNSSEPGTVLSAEGLVVAHADWDHTAKVEVSRLEPGRQYMYQFTCGDARSEIGHFRLPPEEGARLETLTYAIFSCSNYRWGYFHAYREAAERAAVEALDFWLHLGDYIYEYGRNQFPLDYAAARKELDPPHETISLDDYRRRHAHYRKDKDLQKLSAAAALISVWDDHEVANNVWEDGAQEHQWYFAEGDFQARKTAATRAYHEWMPTRIMPHADMSKDSKAPWMRWRKFAFGDLATLLALETRLVARTSPMHINVRGKVSWILAKAGYPHPDQWANSSVDNELQDLHLSVEEQRHNENMHMIGPEQVSWISKEVKASADKGVLWRLVAQPQITQDRMSANYDKAVARARNTSEAQNWRDALEDSSAFVNIATGRYRINKDFDDWMGYPADRARFAEALSAEAPLATALVYGGDSHNAWVGTVRDKNGRHAAAEFDGWSVTSIGMEKYIPYLPPALQSAAWVAANPTMHWADMEHRGFMLVRLNRTAQVVEFLANDPYSSTFRPATCLAAFSAMRGDATVRPATCVPWPMLQENPPPPLVLGSTRALRRELPAGSAHLNVATDRV